MNLLTQEEVLTLLGNWQVGQPPPLSNKMLGDMDFTGHTFVFPVNFSGARFQGSAHFYKAVFLQDAFFNGVVFGQGANFSGAVFRQAARFAFCRFHNRAYFWRARFWGPADFLQMLVYASPGLGPDFLEAAETNFSWAWFMGEASFNRAKFCGPAYFHRTLFFAKASFEESVFQDKAWFVGTPTEVQLSREEFANPALLEELAQAGLLRPDPEAFVEQQGKWLPVFYEFNGILSGAELRAKLQDVAGREVPAREAAQLQDLWSLGAREMFADAGQVSFRAAQFQRPAESTILDVNVDIRRKIREAGIFISYSHQDKYWLDTLLPYLAFLPEAGFEVWTDAHIKTGAEWDQEIRNTILQARVAILLVTPAFLKSSYVLSRELPWLWSARESKGLEICWVPVEESDYGQTPLASLQAALPVSAPLATLGEAERHQALQQLAADLAEKLHLAAGH